MAYILIIDNNRERRNYLRHFLKNSGYTVAIQKDSDPDNSDYSVYDMAIINYFPDVNRTWDLFHQLKQKWPNLPLFVFFYAGIQVLRQLKEAIGQVTARRHYPLIPVAKAI